MVMASSMARKVFPYASIGIMILVTVGYLVFLPKKEIRQPLQYNHKVHIETAGLVCQDCHATVQSSSSATIPRLETCSMCHSESPISESPEERKLLEFVSAGKEIPWVRVYGVPDHVYFSHRRHVTQGKLECSACHGNVAEFTRPVTSAFAPVTMERCMGCHRESGVTNDCLTCHR